METERLLEILADIENRRNRLPESEPCDCKKHLEIRLRKFGGGTHYVYQCQSCGEQRGGSISKKKAAELLNGAAVQDFDERIEEVRRIEARTLFEERMALFDEEKRIRALLCGIPNSESEFRRGQRDFEEANNQLEIVIRELLTKYGQENTVRALIKQTVAIKTARYQELRDSTNRFTCEDGVKKWFVSYFARDFLINQEVWGRHLAADVKLRIDFVLTPKQHLVNTGFDPTPFGVEVKYFKQESGFTHKTSRAFWQTISYNDCEFGLDGNNCKLKFCLLFSNLSFEQEMALVKNYGHAFENDRIEWNGMVHVANHANVGTLQILGTRDAPKGWAINFAGGMYFQARTSMGNTQFSLSDDNLINKVRVGNF